MIRKIIIILLVMFTSVNGYCAITFDVKAESAVGSSDPETLALDCGATANFIVLNVITQLNVQPDGTPTYNGVTMTQAGSDCITGTSEGSVAIWYVQDPDCSASHNFSVGNSGTVAMKMVGTSWISSSDIILDQTSCDSSAAAANPSLTITSVPTNSFVIDGMGNGYRDIITGNSDVLLFSNDQGQWNDASQYEIADSGGSITLSYTQSEDDYAHLGASFTEDAGGGGRTGGSWIIQSNNKIRVEQWPNQTEYLTLKKLDQKSL